MKTRRARSAPVGSFCASCGPCRCGDASEFRSEGSRSCSAIESNRDAYLPDLAMSVNNLANRLAESGRRAEGLTAAQEATQLYRELVAENPAIFGPRAEQAGALAASLSEDTS